MFTILFTSSSSEACQEFTTTSTSLNFEPPTTNKILCYSSLVYCCLLVLNHFVFESVEEFVIYSWYQC